MDEMTASNFYAYVLRVYKRTDKSTEVYEAITDTLLDMTRQHKFKSLEVEAYNARGITSSTDYRLELPVDFEHLLSDVKLINGLESKTLNKLDKPEFDRKYPYLSNPDEPTGIPKDYCVWNEQILIGPRPDTTDYSYEISYTRRITTAITVATTAIPFTDYMKETVRAGTLARLFEDVEDYERAAYWHARYDRDMSFIKQSDEDNDSAPTAQEYSGV